MSHIEYLHRLIPSLFEDTINQLAELIQNNYPTCNMLIGSGLSGTMVIPALACKLNVNWAILRKTLSHSPTMLEVSEWPNSPQVVFVDDLIYTGKTLRMCIKSIESFNKVATMLGCATYADFVEYDELLTRYMNNLRIIKVNYED